MPLMYFDCPRHGEFRKIVSAGTNKEQCPRCRSWSTAKQSHPNAKVRVSVEEGERAEVVRQDELEVRMAAAADEAHRVSAEQRKRRKEAEASLPEEEKERQTQDVEYRAAVEDVMKSEPQEELDKKGLKLWRKTDEHVERMKEKYGEDAVEESTDSSATDIEEVDR